MLFMFLLLLFLLALVALGLIVFWLWMLVDCIMNKKLTDMQRAVWAFAIIVVGPLVALIYFLVGRGPKTYVPPRAYQYRAQTRAQEYRQSRQESSPARNYPPYQEGYRSQDVPRQNTAETVVASDVPQQQQAQYEQIQISYPEQNLD